MSRIDRIDEALDALDDLSDRLMRLRIDEKESYQKEARAGEAADRDDDDYWLDDDYWEDEPAPASWIDDWTNAAMKTDYFKAADPPVAEWTDWNEESRWGDHEGRTRIFIHGDPSNEPDWLRTRIVTPLYVGELKDMTEGLDEGDIIEIHTPLDN